MHQQQEEWRPIPGHDGYEASSLGRVRSWTRRGFEPEPTAPRILSGGTDRYPRLYMRGGKHMRVHQLVALAFIGLPPEGLGGRVVVRHLDDNPFNNRPENLAYGTQRENAFDMVRNGLHPMARKTHCVNGHEFTPETTQLRNDGRERHCLVCRRDRGREYKARLRARRSNEVSA